MAGREHAAATMSPQHSAWSLRAEPAPLGLFASFAQARALFQGFSAALREGADLGLRASRRPRGGAGSIAEEAVQEGVDAIVVRPKGHAPHVTRGDQLLDRNALCPPGDAGIRILGERP